MGSDAGLRALIALCVMSATSLALGQAQAPAANPRAQYVGEAVCLGCHSVEADHFAATIHARAFRGRPRTGLSARGCEACHGAGSAHIADPASASSIVAFTRESGASIAQMNAMCQQCHRGGPLLHWAGSMHAGQDVACSDCHNPMVRTSTRSLLRADAVSATCFTCHPQQRAEFRKRSHMPLFEGKVSCVDCHAPHGSNTDPLLKGDSVNHTCYGCHPEKRGPFLFEHAPVRESCLNCHRPHGSNHDKLLLAARPFLCQQCHSNLDDFGIAHPSSLLTQGDLASDERILNRSCTNCHAQIHGSNHPAGVRLHR